MLTKIYGLEKEDCHLRGKVKEKLLQHFDDESLFVTVSNNEAQVVMSKQVLSDTKQCNFLHQNKSFVLKEAAKVIRDDVVTMIHLYNLASGCLVPSDITESLLSVAARGNNLRNTFFERLDNGPEEKEIFFDPIKRTEWKSFSDLNKKVKVAAKDKSKNIVVQLDILGLLAAKSHQQNAAIIADSSLCYPLALVMLSMRTSDGARKKTAKRKLFDAALSSIANSERKPRDVDTPDKVYILVPAVTVRSTVAIPDMFKELSLHILAQLPEYFERIYVACDIYQENSFKNIERGIRGESDRMVIKSSEMHTFKTFLNNSDNIERLNKDWIKNRCLLDERAIHFARGCTYTKIT